jgi:FtsP/CotA-like multicopper oxidase with cupredoxin domain
VYNEQRSPPLREFKLEASPSALPLVDGAALTNVWAYNGQVPGPLLRIRLGERLRVDFKNSLPQSTTIHWHGVRVPNAMDGVPGVTQPPIPAGGTFRYEFTPKDAGTFWFHPHHRASEQVERGLYGILVVDDPKPLPWSQDVVWVLDDWRLTEQAQVDDRFNTPHDLMHDGRWGNVVSVNGRTREVLVVHPGERVRLRLVNTANARIFLPEWSALRAQVIAVDGLGVESAFAPSGFELAPGNRLDLDLRFAPEDAGKTYLIRDLFGRRPHDLATIQVSAKPPVPTPSFDAPLTVMPSWPEAMSVEPHLVYRLGARRGGEYGITWTLNDAAHGEDTPAVLPQHQWVKLRYENTSSRLHPMHMHGVFFRVLARNGERAVEPHWRDTVLVHPQETVDIGLVPEDIGRWMLHCHILEHAEAGMMTTFTVTPGQ